MDAVATSFAATQTIPILPLAAGKAITTVPVAGAVRNAARLMIDAGRNERDNPYSGDW